MAWIKKNIFFIVLLFFPLLAFGQLKNLQVRSDFYCPYNCSPNSEKKGFLIDILEKMIEETPSLKEFILSYQDETFQKSINDTLSGKTDILLKASPELDHKKITLIKIPSVMQEFCFYTRTNQVWRYEGIPSLKRIKLGIVDGYSYGKDVDKYIGSERLGQKIEVLSGSDAHIRLLQRLRKNHIDVFIADKKVVNYMLTYFPRFTPLRKTGCLRTMEMHIGLSNHFNKELIPKLQESLNKMLLEGKIKKIVDSYHLREVLAL